MSGVLRWSSPWRIHGTNGIFTYMKTIKSSLFCREIYHAWMVWVGGGNSHIFFIQAGKACRKTNGCLLVISQSFPQTLKTPPKVRVSYIVKTKKRGGSVRSCSIGPEGFRWWLLSPRFEVPIFPPPIHQLVAGFFPTHPEKICVVKIGFIIPPRKTHRVSAHFWTSKLRQSQKGKGFLGFWHHFTKCSFQVSWVGKDGSCFSK